MSVKACLFSGKSRLSTVPAGKAAKASSVGAKTVKGPSPLRVSTNSAAPRAAARVVKRPSATAVSTMSARSAGGRMTLSMTWMTPLSAMISVATTLASLIMTLPMSTLMATFLPNNVSASVRLTTSAANTDPETTW